MQVRREGGDGARVGQRNLRRSRAISRDLGRTGVLCGLCLGAVVPRRSAEGVVLALALLAALSLTALALLSTPHVAPTLPPATLFPLLAGLMALSGIGTIGFIGLALSRAVELADGVPEAYAVGAVEMLVQGFGGGLSALSASCTVGLAGCVAVQWLAVTALAAAYGCRPGRPSAGGRLAAVAGAVVGDAAPADSMRQPLAGGDAARES